MKRKISIMAFACFLLSACISEDNFDYREHYEQLRALIRSVSIQQGLPQGEMYDFEESLNYWMTSGWIDAIWDTLEMKYNIRQIYFIVEYGNATWPYYESRSVAETVDGKVLVKVDRRPDTLAGTMGVEIHTKKVNPKDYSSISSDLRNRFHVFELKSSLIETSTYDASVGFCSALYDSKRNQFLLFDVPDVSDNAVREMLQYVDSVFNTSFE